MKYENDVVEAIAMLLVSNTQTDITMGIEMLKQQEQAYESLIIPLMLLKDIQRGELKPIKEACEAYLAKFDKKLLAAKRQVIEILYWADAMISLSSKKAKTALDLFEEHRASIEPIILGNDSYFYLLYRTLGENLCQEPGLESRAIYYLEKWAKSALTDIDGRLLYSEMILNYCFPNQERLEDIPFVIKTMEAAIRINPHMAECYYDILGIIHEAYLNDKVTAKEFYIKAIEANPNYANALNNLANILFKEESNFEEALILINVALELEPDNIAYLDSLACLKWKGFGEYEEAEALFKSILEMDKKDHFALTGLGEVYEAKGDFKLAKDFYTKGLKVRPKSEFKLQKMADLINFKLNKPKEALGYYQQLEAVAKDKTYAQQMCEELNQLLNV